VDKVEEILKQYPNIGEDIKKAQTKLNEFIALQQEARNPLKAQTISDEPHTSGLSDQTYNAVLKIIDRYQSEIDKYTSEINNILDRKKWLDKAFTMVTEDERRLLYMRYDKSVHISKIAYTMRRGRPYIYKMLDEAKNKIKKIMF